MENRELHIELTYKKHNKRLLNFIRKHIAFDQAEDVVQDVFAQLVVGYGQIRSLENISSWLFKTAMNRVIDLKRKKRPDLLQDKKISTLADNVDFLMLEDILPSHASGPEDELFSSAIWEKISESLDEMPEEQKEIFSLHEFEDRSFKEISEITGEKINTLISRKRYAILFLREKLNELYEDLKN